MKMYGLVILFSIFTTTAQAQLGEGKQVGLPNWVDSFGVLAPQKQMVFSVAKPAQPNVKRTLVPQDFYTRGFGFFCKQELNMYKAGFPVSFRLGSMEDCNKLEQKGH